MLNQGLARRQNESTVTFRIWLQKLEVCSAAVAALHFAKFAPRKQPYTNRCKELVQTNPLTTAKAFKLHE